MLTTIAQSQQRDMSAELQWFFDAVIAESEVVSGIDDDGADKEKPAPRFP